MNQPQVELCKIDYPAVAIWVNGVEVIFCEFKQV